MVEILLAKYIEQLRLRDWEISCNVVESFSTQAATKLIYNDYKAVILIRAGMDKPETEKTLIHELLHLIFRDAFDIFDSTVEDDFAKGYCLKQHERAIEKTSQIIYALNHKEV